MVNIEKLAESIRALPVIKGWEFKSTVLDLLGDEDIAQKVVRHLAQPKCGWEIMTRPVDTASIDLHTEAVRLMGDIGEITYHKNLVVIPPRDPAVAVLIMATISGLRLGNWPDIVQVIGGEMVAVYTILSSEEGRNEAVEVMIGVARDVALHPPEKGE